MLTRRIAYLLAARDVGVGPGAGHHVHQQGRRGDARAGGRGWSARAPGRMWVSTFHSTCVRILRNQASLLPGLNSNFSIYDADDSRRLLMMIAKDMGLDIKRYSPRLLANGISNLKNELIDPEQAAARGLGGRRRPGPHRRRGRTASTSAGCGRPTRWTSTTSSARQSLCCKRFRRSPSTTGGGSGTSWSTSTRTPTTRSTCWCANWSGTESADEPTGVPPGELCVVGDADQSIYAFRGATIRNIEDFERDYPNATTILLEQNYRSTQTILSAANSVIARNAGRREKRLWTDAGDGELIVGYVADNEHDEARFVAEEIDALADSAATSPTTTSRCSTAPTTRSRAHRKRSSSGPASRTKSLAAFAFTSAGRSATSSPICGCSTIPGTRSACGASSTRRAAGSATAPRRASRCTPRTPAPASTTRCRPPPRARCRCSTPARRRRSPRFVELLDELRGKLDEELGDLVEAVLDRTGYRRELESSSDPQDLARLDNLNELVSVAHEFSIDLANAEALADEARGARSTRTSPTPGCSPSSWSGCRSSPTPTRFPSTARAW